MEETVTCQICGKQFGSVAHHLHVHNISLQEYQAKFPGYPVISEKTHRKLSSGIKRQWHSLTPTQQAERTRKVQKGKLKRKYFYVQPFWDRPKEPKQQKKTKEPKPRKPRKKRHLIKQKTTPFTLEERKLRNKLLNEMIVV